MEQKIPTQDITKQYLHLSHTREAVNPYIIKDVENIHFTKYDMLWLGGDLTFQMSLHDSVMHYVDSYFNLGNENTLFSIGNHDYDSLERIMRYTHRPTYYSYFKNNITFIVLDTQDSLSNIKGAQKTFFNNVIDTVKNSSHLIILHHKLIWLYNHPLLNSQIMDISNARLGAEDCFWCLNPNNFYEDLYPQLVDIKQKGIEVICIAGDIGRKTKEFEFKTEEGIYFLASGLYYDSIINKALIFEHNITKKELSWEYKVITEL